MKSMGSERRDVTVLFCDLGNYTQWLDEEDPEDVATVLDEIRRKAVMTFESFGGIVNQFVGDEVVGLFGMASSNEDDPVRAIVAASSLHSFVRERRVISRSGTARPLHLHTGVESGLVYTRMRDPRSGVYDVTGDAVNVAARLRSLAEPDQILVGPSVGPRIAPYYSLDELMATLVRGKPLPITAYRVVAQSASSRFEAARARGLTPYVGRQHELELLQAAWAAACLGRGGLVTVRGPAGIGKTRLLFELRKHVMTAPHTGVPLILQGRCSPYADVAPYQVFIDAIGGALASHVRAEGGEHDPIDWLRSLGSLSAQSIDALAYLLAKQGAGPSPPGPVGAPLREAIVDAIVELVLTASSSRAVLILFEDWHTADEPSRTALRALAERAAQHRVLIAINFRPSELIAQENLRSALHLDLLGLDPERTEALACRVLGAWTLPRGLAEFVHERTLGNPFFVEEFCRTLREDGAFVQHSDSIAMVRPLHRLSTPSTVRSIVGARVDRLPLRCRDVLRIASTAGIEFRFDFVETLCSDPRAGPGPTSAAGEDLGAVLTELEAQGMVMRIGSEVPAVYRFQHAITQEVAYSSLPLSHRRAYHERIGELLEARIPPDYRDPHFEALAHHYGLSDRKDKALEYALLAAAKAGRTFSLEQADHQYSQALDLLEQLPCLDRQRKCTFIDTAVSLGRVAIYNPRARVVAHLRQALVWAREQGDRERVALCLDWLTWSQYALGDQVAALASSYEFLESAKLTEDARLIAQALTNIGMCHAMGVEYDAAIDAIERGIQTRARFAGTSYRYARGTLALIYGDRGDFVRARENLASATPQGQAEGRLTLQGPLLIQRAMVECWQGCFSECIETARKARQVAERIEGAYILAMSLAIGAYARLMLEHDPSAIGELQEAVQLLERRQIGLHLSWVYGLLAEGLLVTGKLDEALQVTERIAALTSQHDRLGEVAGMRVRAIALARRDRDSVQCDRQMQRALDAASARRSAREIAVVQLRWAEQLASSGRLPHASSLLHSAIPVFDASEMSFFATTARALCARIAAPLAVEHS